MTDTYNGGYKKAALDIANFLSDHSESIKWFCNTKKKYETMINSLLRLLMTDPVFRERFQSGVYNVSLNNKGEIIPYQK